MRKLRFLPVWLVAAVATLVSAYPVVFLGRSFVSPNQGAFLLYDEWPTLPGYHESRSVNQMGSDIGAVLWQQIPYSRIQRDSIFRDGEWPLWNRHNAGGTPLLGQGQSMFGDPLHLLAVASGGAAWAWDLKYLLAKWLFSLGLGLSVLSLARHRPAALITALAAPFVGFFLYRLNHPAFFSFCYAPWILYGWLRISEAGRWRSTAHGIGLWLLACWAEMNSGTVKEAWILLLTLNLAGLLVHACGPTPLKRRWWQLAASGGAAVLFCGLSSPFWGSFLETLKGAYTTSDAGDAAQIQPALLIGLFDEAFYRPLTQGNWVFDPSSNFLFLGGILYFLSTLREQMLDRRRLVLAGVALATLAFAFGVVPPGWIARWPFLRNVIHIDNCFSCAFIVVSAVLAGFGFEAASRRLGTPDGRSDLVIGALGLFGMAFAYIGFSQASHRSIFGPGLTFSPLAPGRALRLGGFVWGYLTLLVVALIALGWLARQALLAGRLSPLRGVAIALCCGALLWRAGQKSGGTRWPDFVFRPSVRVNFQARSEAMRYVQKNQPEPERAIGLQNNFFPGWTAMYGLEGINGPDALINPYYRALTAASALEPLWGWRLYLSRDNLAASRPFLDFLNVRHYFDLRSDQGALGAVLKLDRTGDLDVYESRTPWPRAFFTGGLETYGRVAELMARISKGDGRPFAAVESAALPSLPNLSSFVGKDRPPAPVPAESYRLTENSTSFTVRAGAPGIVVLTETFWPGYSHATVDGVATPVFRVNQAFVGLAVGPGLHRIRVRYRPAHFSALLIVAAVSGALLAAAYALALSKWAREWESAAFG